MATGDAVAQKTSASFWSTPRNPLNARIGAKLATTISTGQYESRRIEYWVEMDLPSDIGVPEGIDNLRTTLELKIAEAQENIKRSTGTPSSSTSPPKSQKAKATVASAASKPIQDTSQPVSPRVTSSILDSIEISKATWKDHSSGKGQHAIASEVPRVTVALSKGPKDGVVHEGFRYKLWTDSSGLQRISRWHT